MMYGCQGKGRVIKPDTLGGVYISGYILNTAGNGACQIRNATTTDTTIAEWPDPIYRPMFLMKLDTGGAFTWIRFPEADTATYFTGFSRTYDMDVDDAGNSYIMAGLKPGAYANGAFVAVHTTGWGTSGNTALYMLKYNSNGIFQNGYPLPYHFIGNGAPDQRIVRDKKHNRNIITGTGGSVSGDSLFIDGQQINTIYVSSWDDNGNLLWLSQQDSMGQNGTQGACMDRASLDAKGNVYFAGWCWNGYSFNGTVVHNTIGAIGAFVVKLDTAGNNVWVQHSDNSGTVTALQAVVSGNTVAVWGKYATELMIWDTDTLTRITNCGHRPYLARLNANTGAVIGIDSLQAPCTQNVYPANGGGYADGGTSSIAVDRFGNFYVGGCMNHEVYIGNDSLSNVGGDLDWYVAKYGTTNCSVPVVVAVQEINNVAATQVKVYPNPTTGEFTIRANAEMVSVEVYDIVGTKVYTSSIENNKTSIDFRTMAKAIYVYTVQLKQGGTLKGKIIVQ
jgi:hypothetical protein